MEAHQSYPQGLQLHQTRGVPCDVGWLAEIEEGAQHRLHDKAPTPK